MTEETEKPVAQPLAGAAVIESLLATCATPGCGQPIVSVKLDAGSEWSDWSHALTGQQECVVGPGEPPPTDRVN